MAKIEFAKKIQPIEVASGANLMETLLAAELPVASSCHGDGICGKCRVQVLAGQEHLSPPTELEKILRDRLKVPRDYRISCQTCVLGDVRIDTSYW
ncbi:MAG: 2Fe-2S iron-sulfur cluster-binding protein [Bdellovibrionales bacterium]